MNKLKIEISAIGSVLLLVFLSGSARAQAPDTAWTRRYNGLANDYDQACCCGVDGSGYLYVTGYSYNGSNSDCLTIKYDAVTGDTVWTRRYNGPANSTDYAYGCATDDSGNLYIAGGSASVSNMDYLAIKYNAATGDTVWTRRYNGPDSKDDYAYGCAVDGSGNLYITGYSYNNSSYDDYLTIKYNASGDTVWTRRYNGPGNSTDDAYGCAADGLGNLYVTGGSYIGSNCDYLTIKYNAATGDTIWTRRYDGPAGRYDQPMCCAVDGSGNLFVTGSSANGSDRDYLTIRYDAATGDTMWTRRYDGRSYHDDFAYACVPDGRGSLYVTGSSYNGSNRDYVTIKYDVATGDSVWTRRYNSPSYNNDDAYGCAVDGSDNLYVSGGSYIGSNCDYLTIKYLTATGVAGTGLEKAVSSDRLGQNRPNPCHSATLISYLLSARGNAGLLIYNAAGRLVKEYRLKDQTPGPHAIKIPTADYANGIYFYALTAGGCRAIKKMVVLK